MSEGERMPYETALEIAKRWAKVLEPFCRRVEIAGSIRRKRPEVGDIEIVCQPFEDTVVTQPDLFGQPRGVLRTPVLGEAQLMTLARENGARWVKGGLRYVKLELGEGCALDLFMVRPPAQFGLIYLIRTGPAAFSEYMVTRPKQMGMKVEHGALWQRYAGIVPTPEEKDVFRVLKVKYIKPEDRA